MNRLLLLFSPVDTQILLLQDQQILRFSNEFSEEHSQIDAIIKGRVLRVIPGLQAAFVDIGLSRPGYLQQKDLQPARTQVLMPGDNVIVQVTKDETRDKGARLRERFSLAARAVAYSAFDTEARVSQRITGVDHTRLLALMQSLSESYPGAFVARTNAIDCEAAEIHRQAENLATTWQDIFTKSATVNAPTTLLPASTLIDRVLREWPLPKPLTILVNDAARLAEVQTAVNKVLPHTAFTVADLATDDSANEIIEAVLENNVFFAPKVNLASGAFMLVERSALGWTIDLNSGSNVGTQNIENSAWEINCEALPALVQLISLRELSGSIVVDFLHMEQTQRWQELKQKLLALLRAEHTGVHVECVPSMGIVLISRRKERPDILARNMHICASCQGSGWLLTPYAMMSKIYQMAYAYSRQGHTKVVFKLHPDMLKQLQHHAHLLQQPIKANLGMDFTMQAVFYLRPDEVSL